MSFLILLITASLLAAALARVLGLRLGLRDAMRLGMAAAFCFTGIDHFLNDTQRYLPMIPPPLATWGLELVWLTGVAELAGALGLAWPRALGGGERLRRAAAIGLSVLLVCVLPANLHVAMQGAQVEGLPFGALYYWTRPLLQPVFIVWALYAVGCFGQRPRAFSHRPAGAAASHE